MKNGALVTLAPLAIVANACVTQQDANDSIRVSVDLLVEDVDVSCTSSRTDALDEASDERVAGLVDAPSGPLCYVFGYYRGPVLDFGELQESLPEGVTELSFTSVAVDIQQIDTTVENLPALPNGTNFELGLAVATDLTLAEVEDPFDPTLKDDSLGFDLLIRTFNQEPGTLVHVGTNGAAVSDPLPLDELVATILSESTAAGNPEQLAGIFDDAYAGGAETLYVLGGAYFAIDRNELPADPSDVTIAIDAVIDYEATAKVNLLDAARSARE